MSKSKPARSQRDLLTGSIGKTLKDMTVPMILGVVILLTFGLVDTYFVSLLGTDELAAISFTFPVTFTLVSLNIGLGIGTSAIIAKYLGAGSKEHAKECGSGAILMSFLMVGTLAFIGWLLIEPIFKLMGANPAQLVHIKDYMNIWYFAGVFLAMPMVGNSVLRAAGDTKTPSLIMSLGGFINAVLDPILIFGYGPFPEMGIEGAAVATAIAWMISCFCVIRLLIKRDLILNRWLTLDEFIKSSAQVLKIGLPAAGSNMMTPIAVAVITAVVAGFGTEAVAAWGVGSRLESIASVVVLALSMTLPPFISQNFGANNIERVKMAYRQTIRFVVIWQLFVYLVLALCAPVIVSAFTDDNAVGDLIYLFLFIVPLSYGVQGIVVLTNSSFNAMHKPMMAVILSIFRLFVFFIPISYIGSRINGLEGLFWGSVVANLLTSVLAIWGFERLLKETQGEQRLEQEATS